MKKVLIIGGSPRLGADSKTTKLVREIEEAAREVGLDVNIWLLGERPLPTAMPHYHEDPMDAANPQTVRDFAKNVRDADLLVLTTPTYHGSYSSHLKNALDCLGGDGFSGKTVVIASQGWSATAMGPAMHLQDVVRTLEGTPFRRFLIANAGDLDSTKGSGLKERITDIIKEAAI